MEHPENGTFTSSTSAAASLTTAEYVRLLHPTGASGKPSVVWKDATGAVHTKTYELNVVPAWVVFGLEGDIYISLHRFHGPRRIDRLASLNALFLDLDVDRLPSGASPCPVRWTREVEMSARTYLLPEPSMVVSTGRGLAALWMIEPVPGAALRRWQPVQNALIDLFAVHGADPKCRDAARVTRIPGSTNSKNGKTVEVLSGSLRRYDFDDLSDAIYAAAGRPTREQLKNRRREKAGRKETEHQRGLTPRERFNAILRDLERIRDHAGGTIPEGRRNIWLHLYATCLTHVAQDDDIEAMVHEKAMQATPGLPIAEIRAIARQAVRHAARPRSKTPLADGRLHYSGATIAGLLDIAPETAAYLRLEQILPPEERARRKAERQLKRRRQAGSIDRDAWLREHEQEAQRPWETLGISRPTYFRWKKAGKLGP